VAACLLPLPPADQIQFNLKRKRSGVPVVPEPKSRAPWRGRPRFSLLRCVADAVLTKLTFHPLTARHPRSQARLGQAPPMGMDPRRSAFVVLGQVQECRTKPSIAGLQAAAVVPQRRDLQRSCKSAKFPRGGEVRELVFIECDLHHANASKR
jgi:hypothetical protein